MISASFQPNTRLYGVRVPSLPLGPRLRSFVDIFLVTREVEGQRELGVAARLRAAVVLFALVERDVPLQTKLPLEGLLANSVWSLTQFLSGFFTQWMGY